MLSGISSSLKRGIKRQKTLMGSRFPLKEARYVARVLRLTLLAPEIVHAALSGALPDNVGVEDLLQPLPALWSKQKKLFGIE